MLEWQLCLGRVCAFGRADHIVSALKV
jgi:hypothetical protein